MSLRGLSSIELSVGETRSIRIRMRRVSTGGYLNVNGVTKIEVEASLVDSFSERTLPPILLDRTSIDADWVNGLLIVPFSPDNVTARPGTYEYNVLVWGLDGENPVFEGGRQEVKPRNKIEKWVRRDGGAYWTDNVRAGKATADMRAGTPIENRDGVLYPAVSKVSGVLLADTVAGYAALWARDGWVSKLDWTGIYPTQYLAASTVIGVGPTPGSLLDTIASPFVGLSDVTGTKLTFGNTP